MKSIIITVDDDGTVKFSNNFDIFRAIGLLDFHKEMLLAEICLENKQQRASKLAEQDRPGEARDKPTGL